MPNSILLDLRTAFHASVCGNILGYRTGGRVLSNADSSSNPSIRIAAGMAANIGCTLCPNPPNGQRSGALFGRYVKEFVENAFSLLAHLRPGEWNYSLSQGALGIAAFDQYDYIAELQRVLQAHTDLKAALGGDYLITPDLTVSRSPVTDQDINAPFAQPMFFDPAEGIAQYTPLRRANNATPRKTLHASISCKWTMRSDRSQNTRTEALNLIRNRKGKTPAIAVVTFEPLPGRLASIAMGTGDVDCTYHGALPELISAVRNANYEDSFDLLMTLVDGRRLRDISDLPFDLAL